MRFDANVRPKETKTHEVGRWSDLERTINGGIEYGTPSQDDGTPASPGNIKGSWLTVTTPATPNTDFSLEHGLGTIPSGIDVKQKDGPVDVYNGSTSHTATHVTLRATQPNVKLQLFVH